MQWKMHWYRFAYKGLLGRLPPCLPASSAEVRPCGLRSQDFYFLNVPRVRTALSDWNTLHGLKQILQILSLGIGLNLF